MRYLVQHHTIAGKQTEDYATEPEAVDRAAELKAAGKRDVVWFVAEGWEAA